MIIYHGSPVTVVKPLREKCKTTNDYGQGFYCAEDIELAKEWACKDAGGGFVNIYELPEDDLKILDLKDMGLLPWIAILVSNRIVRYSSPVEKRAAEYLIDHFAPIIDKYDVIIGYRADDSYFSYTRAFLSNTITLEQLGAAIKLGDLGIQICVKSARGFDIIKYLNAESVNGELYYPRRVNRDNRAREEYYKLLEEDTKGGIFVRDIIEKRVNDDELRI